MEMSLDHDDHFVTYPVFHEGGKFIGCVVPHFMGGDLALELHLETSNPSHIMQMLLRAGRWINEGEWAAGLVNGDDKLLSLENVRGSPEGCYVYDPVTFQEKGWIEMICTDTSLFFLAKNFAAKHRIEIADHIIGFLYTLAESRATTRH